MNNEQESFFKKEDVISIYSSEEGVEDGILVELEQVNRYFKNSPFSLATTNLLEKGYIKDEKINVPNMIDLITQSLRIFRKKTEDDSFVSGRIELPSGKKQEVFISQNETGRYTIMLPEDY